MLQSATKEKTVYFAVSMAFMILTNRILFPLGSFLARGRAPHDLSLPLDALFPLLPWTMLFYFGCFLWWGVVYWLVSLRDREEADRFFAANLLAKLVCLLFFAFFPTTIVRPAPSGSSLWVRLLELLYRVDTPDNLFPSVHCYLGWLCWIGLRGKKDCPFAVRAFSLLMALAVCVSTLTVRQHVLADVFGGIALSEVCFALCGMKALRRAYGVPVDTIVKKLLRSGDNR